MELRALKQQLAISQTTRETATRELQEKGAQVALLQQELQLARQEVEQLQEEVSTLDYMFRFCNHSHSYHLCLYSSLLSDLLHSFLSFLPLVLTRPLLPLSILSFSSSRIA